MRTFLILFFLIILTRSVLLTAFCEGPEALPKVLKEILLKKNRIFLFSDESLTLSEKKFSTTKASDVASQTKEVKKAKTEADVSAIEKTSLKLMDHKISLWLAAKSSGISSPEALTQHSYALLLTSAAFNRTARSFARDTSIFVVRNAAWSAIGSAARYTARDAARNVARNVAWSAAVDATWSAAVDAARDTAWPAVWSAGAVAKDVAMDVAMDTITSEVTLLVDQKNLTEAKEIGKLAYYLAEAETLAYFFQKDNFYKIFDAAFDAALNAVRKDHSITPESGIFRSQADWELFKKKHFGTITVEARRYLTPWLVELDQLVVIIEGLSASP